MELIVKNLPSIQIKNLIEAGAEISNYKGWFAAPKEALEIVLSHEAGHPVAPGTNFKLKDITRSMLHKDGLNCIFWVNWDEGFMPSADALKAFIATFGIDSILTDDEINFADYQNTELTM
jgi:hypothetical protein